MTKKTPSKGCLRDSSFSCQRLFGIRKSYYSLVTPSLGIICCICLRVVWKVFFHILWVFLWFSGWSQPTGVKKLKQTNGERGKQKKRIFFHTKCKIRSVTSFRLKVISRARLYKACTHVHVTKREFYSNSGCEAKNNKERMKVQSFRTKPFAMTCGR